MDSQNLLLIISIAVPVFIAIGGYSLAKRTEMDGYGFSFVYLQVSWDY